MLSSLKATVKPLALTLGAGGLIFASYEAIGFVVSIDALNRYRIDGPTEAPGAEMLNGVFTAYNGARLVTKGKVDRLTFTRDRTIANLEGIKEGQFFNEKGDEYGYSAQFAKYQYGRRVLEIASGGRFWGKDVDITAPEITMNRPLQQVEAPGRFSGKLSGGQVQATNLFYNLRDKNWRAGEVEWSGKLSLQEQGGQTRTWNVKGSEVESDGDMLHYTKARAWDGEVIVLADKIDHNTKTKVLVATGNVKYFGIDANMTCPKATVYQNEKRLLLEGGVNMLIKPKGGTKPEETLIEPLTPFVPDEIKAGRPEPPEKQKGINQELRTTENLRKYPTRVIAQKVEYWYKKGSRRAVITGAPQARQDIPGEPLLWRMVWGHSADWDGEKDLLTVKSSNADTKDARLKMSNGDNFKALRFIIATQENSKSWKATEGEGAFDVDDEETSGGGTGGGSTGGGTGGRPSLSGPIGT